MNAAVDSSHETQHHLPLVIPANRRAATGYGVAWKVAKGPRPEVQDLPFHFLLDFTVDGYQPHTGDRPRHPRDLVVSGIIDGMGGSRVSLDNEAAGPLIASLDSRLITRDYAGRKCMLLTGRAAAEMVVRSLRRHVQSLPPGLPSTGDLRSLLSAVNRDLWRFNEMLVKWGVVKEQDRHGRLGAAITLAISDRQGLVRYANCGDCRAGIVRADGAVVELSRKQTMASMSGLGLGTTVGHVDDHKILNAIGVYETLDPAVTEASVENGDALVHLTDGAKEALMHAPALAGVPWDERTLQASFRATVVPAVAATSRSFPAVHELFRDAVLPYLAVEGDARSLPKVHDNVSLMVVRRTRPVAAAIDALYTAIDQGGVELSGGLGLQRHELIERGRADGLQSDAELQEFEEALTKLGLRVVG